MMNVAAALDTMRAANRISRRQLFSWTVISLDQQAPMLSCNLPLQAQQSVEYEPLADALMIIAGFNVDKHLPTQQFSKLRQYSKKFALVIGIESGSWVMAKLGLLAGKKATTHWEDLEEFDRKFPNIKVRPDRFIIDGNCVTIGGASPTIDFILYWIRQRYGYTLALEVASVFLYDNSQNPNDPQPLVALGALQHHEPRVAASIRLMEANLDTPITIKTLAASSEVKLSVRQLENLFHNIFAMSPKVYYLRLRLQTARRLVINTQLPIYEIAIRTGFSETAAFSRAFKNYYQLSPSLYRQQARQ